jgi:hypothetical protein
MSTTKSMVLVKHHLKSLKLPTMSLECEKVASRAAVENLDHLAYLQRLCELELIERERRAVERRLKAARFPQTKTLDEFDFTQQPSINKPLVLELAKGQYIDNRENVLLIGSSGVGKTHLAIASRTVAIFSRRRARGSASAMLVGGSDVPQALPAPPPFGATSYPRVDSKQPQHCTFRPAGLPRPALHFSTGVHRRSR